MNLLKTIFALGAFLVGLMLSACSDDGNDSAQPSVPDQKPLTKIEKMFVGGWPELGSDGVIYIPLF